MNPESRPPYTAEPMRTHGSEAAIQNPEWGRQRRDVGKRGFTLIELMVATAILVIITMIVARIFQQASSSWRTGSEKVETLMNGRAVADFIAQTVSQAIPDTNGTTYSTSGLPLDFQVIIDATSTNRAVYKLTGVDKADLADGIMDAKIDTYGDAPAGGLPAGGVVTVKIASGTATNTFQSGFYFQNRDRNRL